MTNILIVADNQAEASYLSEVFHYEAVHLWGDPPWESEYSTVLISPGVNIGSPWFGKYIVPLLRRPHRIFEIKPR